MATNSLEELRMSPPPLGHHIIIMEGNVENCMVEQV